MNQPSPTPDLPPHYYLDNFSSIVQTVTTRYSDLLSHQEQQWLTQFSALPLNAKLLIVRLLSRTGSWFRRDKLHYSEIDDLDGAISALERQGFISVTHQPPFEAMANLLTKPELLQHFAHLPVSAGWRKSELVNTIANTLQDSPPPALHAAVLCVHHDILPLFLLLYFGNARQDLSQFVLSDLGIYRFESVTLCKEDRLFTSRDQIENWLYISALAEKHRQLAGEKDRAGIIALTNDLPEKPSWAPLTRKWERLANTLARECERQGQLQEASALYANTTLPPASERLARIAIKQERFEDAAKHVTRMLEHPQNEDEYDVACRLSHQLAKKTSIESAPKPVDNFQANTLTLPLTQRVERAVAHHFAEQGWSVWFCENALANALFGLLYWDILFAPVAGAFLNPFQRSPRDMYSSDFAAARHALIEARQRQFLHQDYSLLTTFDTKHGITNDWVNWQWTERDMIASALATLSRPQIVAITSRILFDPRTNRAGQPDLFMTKEHQCQFVEVKGPGDKLQHHQIRWLNFLCEQNIDASVLFVNAI